LKKSEHLVLPLEVKNENKYFGNWKAALDEAKELAIELNMTVQLVYAKQYQFMVSPGCCVFFISTLGPPTAESL